MSTADLRERVLAALSQVHDPELHKDLVALGMIQDLTAENGVVSMRVDLTTPACPLKEQIERDVRAAVMAVPGVRDLRLAWGAQVRRSVAPAQNLIPGVRNTIVVGSGKGGVGKSTVAANLALALARDGATVGLFDADIYGPNQPTMLGVSGRPHGDEKNKIIPFEAPLGVRLISMGFFLKPDEPVIWRGPMLHGAVRQFLADVAWGDLDYLIVDLPPGTGDVQLTLSQIIPLTGAVLVTTPQAVALEDMRKAALMFHKVNVPLLGLIENMSGWTCRHCGEREDLFGRDGGRRAAEDLGIPFLGAIPIDVRVMAGGDAGKPVVLHDPESPAAIALREAARALAGQVSVQAFAGEMTVGVESGGGHGHGSAGGGGAAAAGAGRGPAPRLPQPMRRG